MLNLKFQEIPVSKPWEKVTGPPVLPPQLLQVILNKDTPVSVSSLRDICNFNYLILSLYPFQCEPTLLPEPNHVMLNHLYALSIKDGVMVLSATHRYRKKYVTTLLYKPIDTFKGWRGIWGRRGLLWLYSLSILLYSQFTLSRVKWDYHCIAGMFIEGPYY